MVDLLIDNLIKASAEAVGEDILNSEKIDFYLDIPKNEKFGDYSSTLPLVFSKWTNTSPMKIAESIVNALQKYNCDFIDHIDIVKPGFINFYLTSAYWFSALWDFNDKSFFENIGNNKKVQVEFISANPTGPLHVGHGRCAVFGDALANLLKKTGYSVEKEYYINDAGNQINLLGQSVLARYKQLTDQTFPFPDNGYQGDYIIDIAKNLRARGINFSKDTIDEISLQAANIILGLIKKDLDLVGVSFDTWFNEKSLFETGKVKKTLELLKEGNFVFEKNNALWMRTTSFGDQKDRVLIKSTGETTYYASDIAYHQDKYQRGFQKIINIWGADHHGYIDRIKAGIKALGYKEESLNVLLVQLVKLVKGGNQINMSTRGGSFVSLEEVISEVGKDACRFFFLLRRHDSQLEFDLDLAKEQSKENPVYYVQYAHARICSIISEAKKAAVPYDNISEKEILNLSSSVERRIIKKLTQYPLIIRLASNSLEPHRITFYLIELAKLFHSYYKDHRIISSDLNITRARIYLLLIIKKIIFDGLSILGISAPEYM
ncbi:MAG: arginine--tRNA ligase [bacterium]